MTIKVVIIVVMNG